MFSVFPGCPIFERSPGNTTDRKFAVNYSSRDNPRRCQHEYTDMQRRVSVSTEYNFWNASGLICSAVFSLSDAGA